MSNALPTVTIIIPTRPGQTEIQAVRASRALDYPQELLEIIVARGRQPAIQRNAALKIAQGELISSFGEDRDGEIYFTSFDGKIYALAQKP